jgi:hypothetical protein
MYKSEYMDWDPFTWKRVIDPRWHNNSTRITNPKYKLVEAGGNWEIREIIEPYTGEHALALKDVSSRSPHRGTEIFDYVHEAKEAAARWDCERFELGCEPPRDWEESEEAEEESGEDGIV